MLTWMHANEQLITARYLSTAPSPAIPETPFGVTVATPMSPAMTAPRTPMTMTSLAPKSADTNPFETTLRQGQIGPTETSWSSRQMREAKLLDESAGPIATIFNNVLRYIDSNLLDLLKSGEKIMEKNRTRGAKPRGDDPESDLEEGASEAAEEIADPEANFEFMANSIWTPVAETIMAELGGVLFAAGRVAELHQVSKRYSRRTLDTLQLKSLRPRTTPWPTNSPSSSRV